MSDNKTKNNKETKTKSTKKKLINEEMIEMKKNSKSVTKKQVKEKEKVLLNKNEQKNLKILSKIVNIIAKVLRICAMVIAPLVFITVILIPLIFSKIEIDGNIIKFDDARFVFKDDYIAVSINNKVYIINDNIQNIDEIVHFLNDNSLSKLVLGTELTLLFIGIIIVVNIYLLKHMEDLFKNIYMNKTPFIEENNIHIRKIGIIMTISLAISIIFNVAISFFIENPFKHHIATYSIISILIVYIIYYIFKYATNIQKNSNSVIYN